MDEQERNFVNPENGEQPVNNTAPESDIPWYQQKPKTQQEYTAPVQEQTAQAENSESAAKESAYSPYYSQQATNSQPQQGGYYAYSQNNPQQSQPNGYYAYTPNNVQQTAQPNTATPKKDKKTGRRIIAAILVAAVIFCGVFGAYLIKNRNVEAPATNNGTSQGGAELKISDSANIAEIDSSDGLSAKEIYAKNVKSNVGIILYASGTSLFAQGNGQSNGSNIAGEGSGIVMGTSSDKSKTYIITCAHVISSAQSKDYKVVVQDYNGKQYDATVVGADAKTDIGVISISEKGLTPAEFGDSSKLVIGETVYAIGNPGGTEFFGSYTRGMISAIDRPVGNEIGYDMKSIQHDAAINPGNSGGMLINSAGQVVGINSSKIASTEYEGMGFAIPITSAKPIIDDLIANGYVTNRPKLGITYSPVSAFRTYAMVAHYNDLPAGSLIIREISKTSAFTGTKAKVGDLIIAVNGEPMETADVLLDKIEKGKVGQELKLTICRIDENTYDITKFDVTVKLIEDTGVVEPEQSSTQPFDWGDFFGN